MERLSGSVERITFYNPENGYSVIRLRADKNGGQGTKPEGLVTITGNLPELSPGEHLKLQGEWIKHPKHGKQFNAETCERVIPATIEGLRRYLGSGLLTGIGPKLADRIVDHFGLDTLEVIENHPQQLRKVQDIGKKRTRQIITAWEEQKQVKEIMLFLHSYGVSTNLAIKIYKQYENQSMNIVKNNPYQLSRDIYGVGFKTADKIAQALGLPADHPSRIEAGLIFRLEEMTKEGNVFSPQELLIQTTSDLLNLPVEIVVPGIERLNNEELVRIEMVPINENNPTSEGLSEAVYLTPYFFAERNVAHYLIKLAGIQPSKLSDLPPSFVNLEGNLSPEQDHAIRTALSHPISVLTGGPGTGKTTTVKALIAAVESGNKRFALCSPTGRAAKRLSETTGKPASTIHRLLEYSPRDGFQYNPDSPLLIDLLVVDETSMLDLLLANNLLKALETGTHIVFVGDFDQLPPVGAGDVLRDLIASDLVPITRLGTIFRQAAESDIITIAHQINQGKLPQFSKKSDDLFLFPAKTPEEAGDWVQDIVTNRIPSRFGFDPVKDIQVLVPMYRGPAGIDALNSRLQEGLNPPGALKGEHTLFGQTFRPGDKVMQVKNDYEKQVFNGDIGFMVEISPIAHTIDVDFEGRTVTYAFSETDQLILAYAISVHKAQGSEFNAVVIPLLTQHYMMLQRNLLYTAITRAKKLCVLVSNKKAMAIAVKNNKVAERNSALAWRLRGG